MENKIEQWINYAEDCLPEFKVMFWQGALHLHFRSLFLRAQSGVSKKKDALLKRNLRIKDGLEKTLSAQPNDTKREKAFLNLCLRAVCAVKGDEESGESLSQDIGAEDGSDVHECVMGELSIFGDKKSFVVFPSKIEFIPIIKDDSSSRRPSIHDEAESEPEKVLLKPPSVFPRINLAPVPPVNSPNFCELVIDALSSLKVYAALEYDIFTKNLPLCSEAINLFSALYKNGSKVTNVKQKCTTCSQMNDLSFQLEKYSVDSIVKEKIDEAFAGISTSALSVHAKIEYCLEFFCVGRLMSVLGEFLSSLDPSSPICDDVMKGMCLPLLDAFIETAKDPCMKWCFGDDLCAASRDMVRFLSRTKNGSSAILEMMIADPDKIPFLASLFRPWENVSYFIPLFKRFFSYYCSLPLRGVTVALFGLMFECFNFKKVNFVTHMFFAFILTRYSGSSVVPLKTCQRSWASYARTSKIEHLTMLFRDT